MEALGAQETGRSVINEMCGSLRANFQRRQEQQRPANPGEGAAAVWFSRRRRAAHFPAAHSPRCFEIWVSRLCRTASGRASGTGAASVPTHRVKSPRPRWPMRFATRWKRPMRVRTCSSADVS